MRTRYSREWAAAMLFVFLLPMWLARAENAAPGSSAQACDPERHRRDLADPVALALSAGGWPSVDAYLAQRDTFMSYRQMVAKYKYSPSNGFFKNVATHFKQNDILNPPDAVKNGQKTQQAAADLIFHAAAVHPELAQGTWLKSLLELVESGPNAPAFTSLEDAQSKIAGFAGFATPAEQQSLEQPWICHQ
jgi:hypothetical protein